MTFKTAMKPGLYDCHWQADDSLGHASFGSFQVNVTRNGGNFDDSPPTVLTFTVSDSPVEVGTTAGVATIHVHVTDETAIPDFGTYCTTPGSFDQPQANFQYEAAIGQYAIYDRYSGRNGTLPTGLTNLRDVDITFGMTFKTAMKPGLYDCHWQADDSLGHASFGSFQVSVNRTPPGQPSSPVKPTFSQQELSAGTLSWSAPETLGKPSLTGYVVQSSPDGSSWSDLKNGATAGTSLPISNLKADTDYWFRVRGENGGTVGQDTAFMNLSWATIKVHTLAPTVAAAPTLFKASNITAVSWTAPATNGGSAITDFKVETSRDGGKTWAVAAKQAPSTSTTLGLTGLAPGTTYQVRVSAINGVGASGFLTGELKTLGSVASQPLNVSASSVAGTTLTLNWDLPATNGGLAISDYKVASWTVIPHTASAVRTFNVTNLTKNKAYQFRVSAINSLGAGAASDVLKVSTLATVAVAPTGFNSTSITTGAATLGWSAPTDNGGASVTDYKVEISRDGNSWTTVPRTASTSRSQNVTGLAPGTTYQVKVSALNSVGYSTPLAGSFKTLATTPAAITGLNTSNVAGTTLNLGWNLPTNNGGAAISDYSILVSSTGSNFKAISHTPSNLLTYKVTNLAAGTKYWFKVAAVNSMGLSAYSDPITIVTVGNAPNAPTSLNATNAAGSQIKLGWKAAAVTGGSAVRDYKIEYSGDNGRNWKTIIKDISNATTITTTGLKANTTYLLRVTAINDVGNSPASATLKVVTK
jgi:titin